MFLTWRNVSSLSLASGPLLSPEWWGCPFWQHMCPSFNWTLCALCAGQGQFVKKTDLIIVGMDTVVVWPSGKQSHQETGNILSCHAQRNWSAAVGFVRIPDGEIILRERESGLRFAERLHSVTPVIVILICQMHRSVEAPLPPLPPPPPPPFWACFLFPAVLKHQAQ